MDPTYWCHDLDLSRSRDVIGHVTKLFAICHFRLVFYWNRGSIFDRFEIFASKYIWVTTILRHVTSRVTLPLYSPGVISYRCSIVIASLSPAIFEIMGPKHVGVTAFDLSRSRDVIGHVTNRFAICYFLLVSQWNQISIFNRITA